MDRSRPTTTQRASPSRRSARCASEKLRARGLDVVGEYVEPGRSATSMDKRVAFQEMLARIKTDKDLLHYVIVYKLLRMNRNRIEDALVVDKLQRSGVTLISATEAIDDSRNGRLLHGILEQSTSSGPPKMAPTSATRWRTRPAAVAPSERRHWATATFVSTTTAARSTRSNSTQTGRLWLSRPGKVHATGDYSLEISPRSWPTVDWSHAPPSVVPRKQSRRTSSPTFCRNVYYLGKIEYQGVIYEGRHEAIVDQELFDRVQDILVDARRATRRARATSSITTTSGVCSSAIGATTLADCAASSTPRLRARRTAAHPDYKCRGNQ